MGSGISIALATYNGAKYLQEQLDSYLTQTLLPDELVVSDDGSTDDTLKIVEEFAKIAPFKVVILQPGPRLGFALNFMRAADACNSDYIAFSDQDDVWLPHKLAVCSDCLRRTSSILVSHTLWSTDENLNITGLVRHEIKKDNILKPLEFDPQGNIQGNTIVFCAKLLNIINYKELHCKNLDNLVQSHDIYIAFLAAAFGQIYFKNEPLVLYRQHSNNVAGAETRNYLKILIKTIKYRTRDMSNKILFYNSAIKLFEELTFSSDSKVAENAKIAQIRYKMRLSVTQKRLKIYQSKFIYQRAYFFFIILLDNFLKGEIRRKIILSRIKDLFFGVFYFTKI